MEYLRKKNSLEESLRRRRGIDVSLCYQCTKCTAGCPSSSYMEAPPHKIIRMIQLGLEKVLYLDSPWFCVSCLACSVRCPNGIEVSKVMDFLREESIKGGTADKESEAFHRIFLDNVKNKGRINEVAFMGRFVMETGRIAKEMKWAIKSFFKGKFHLFPSKVKNMDHIKKIFLRCKV